MPPFFILMAAGVFLFCGDKVASQAGGILANELAGFLPPAQITAILSGMIASIGFAVGTSGIANCALMSVILASLVGGGWIGFTFSDAGLEPVAFQQESAVRRGVGITDVLTCLPTY